MSSYSLGSDNLLQVSPLWMLSSLFVGSSTPAPTPHTYIDPSSPYLGSEFWISMWGNSHGYSRQILKALIPMLGCSSTWILFSLWHLTCWRPSQPAWLLTSHWENLLFTRPLGLTDADFAPIMVLGLNCSGRKRKVENEEDKEETKVLLSS